MTPSTLVNVLDAIVAGMATVTNLSSTAVTKYDYRVLDLPTSATVTPEFSGEQAVSASGESDETGYIVVHRVKLQITVTQRGDVQDLLAAASGMIPPVLAWFRAHKTLGLTDCLSCHWEPLTWNSPGFWKNPNGVLGIDITFAVTVALTV